MAKFKLNIIPLLVLIILVLLFFCFKGTEKLENTGEKYDTDIDNLKNIIMEPHFMKNDKDMFYKYLNMIKVYFEYGSGGSTYQAYIRPNIYKIYSVESDPIWLNKLKNIFTSFQGDKKDITYIFNEVDAQPNEWGRPGKNATDIQKKNYSNHITKLNREDQLKIDFVLIDGRFRVACCLKCFDIINKECLIAFDDFLNRKKYHIVLDYFDILEKTEDNTMVILKKKKNIYSVPKEIITKYELISD